MTFPVRAEPSRLSYIVTSQGLAPFLAEVAQANGYTAEIDVSGAIVITRRSFSGPLTSILDTLARDFGLTWVSTGDQLFIASNDRLTSRTVSVAGTERDVVRNALVRANLETRPDLVRVAEDGSSVELRGPEKFVKLVADRLGQFPAVKSAEEVRVIRSGKVGGPE